MRRNEFTRRCGSTFTELIVAATLLIAGLGLLSRCAFRLVDVQQDTRHYQLVLDELANQLERLSLLDGESLQTALADLQPAESMHKSLPGVRLTAEILNDQDGERIVLSAIWDRKGPAQPVTLVGWIEPAANGGQREE